VEGRARTGVWDDDHESEGQAKQDMATEEWDKEEDRRCCVRGGDRPADRAVRQGRTVQRRRMVWGRLRYVLRRRRR
jgi:hypothetical protein